MKILICKATDLYRFISSRFGKNEYIKNGRKRFVVINVHIDYESNDLTDYTDTHRQYCARFDYQYIQITKNLLLSALPTWSKHVAALDNVAKCDGLMIIDSDAEILETCPPFHELLNSNQPYDLFFAFGHSFRPNAGVILLRGMAKTSVLFLKTLLEEREHKIPEQDQARAGGDNGHVINLLRREEFKSKLFILGANWNNTTKPTDWDFVRHYTGPMTDFIRSKKL